MRFKFPYGDFASLISLAYSSTLSWIYLLLSLTKASRLSLANMTFSIKSKSLKPFLCTISFRSIYKSYSSEGSLLEFFFKAANEIACWTSNKRFWIKLSKFEKVKAYEAPDGCEFKNMFETSFKLLIESIWTQITSLLIFMNIGRIAPILSVLKDLSPISNCLRKSCSILV
jgi:hypothetical protein